MINKDYGNNYVCNDGYIQKPNKTSTFDTCISESDLTCDLFYKSGYPLNSTGKNIKYDPTKANNIVQFKDSKYTNHPLNLIVEKECGTPIKPKTSQEMFPNDPTNNSLALYEPWPGVSDDCDNRIIRNITDPQVKTCGYQANGCRCNGAFAGNSTEEYCSEHGYCGSSWDHLDKGQPKYDWRPTEYGTINSSYLIDVRPRKLDINYLVPKPQNPQEDLNHRKNMPKLDYIFLPRDMDPPVNLLEDYDLKKYKKMSDHYLPYPNYNLMCDARFQGKCGPNNGNCRCNGHVSKGEPEICKLSEGVCVPNINQISSGQYDFRPTRPIKGTNRLADMRPRVIDPSSTPLYGFHNPHREMEDSLEKRIIQNYSDINRGQLRAGAHTGGR